MIAVCGGMYDLFNRWSGIYTIWSATGAGKSSILNAILDGKPLSFCTCFTALVILCTQTILCRQAACEVCSVRILFFPCMLNYKSTACTAVVTEIGYHSKKTIDADVSFLSEKEWRDELAVLLEDLVDEDGNIKRSTDLRSDAGVAWQKASHPSFFCSLSSLKKL